MGVVGRGWWLVLVGDGNRGEIVGDGSRLDPPVVTVRKDLVGWSVVGLWDSYRAKEGLIG